MLPPGWPEGAGLAWHAALDSTQSEARRLAEAGERGPLWIVAERQSQGIGRRGRGWDSPAGNLYATLLFAPHVPALRLPELSFVASLAVLDLFDRFAPGAASLKWPNDPLLNGRKAAGILPDSSGRPGQGAYVALGFGINLVSSPQDAPYPTACLADAATPPALAEVVTALALAFARRETLWLHEGFVPVRAAWLARAHGLGAQVTVRLPDESFDAVFEGLDTQGALIARLPDGQHRLVAAGDVFPVQPVAAR